MKQAPWNWFNKLSITLIKHGFTRSKADDTLFFKIELTYRIYRFVYVNNIIVTRFNNEIISMMVKRLNDDFALKDMGLFYYFLGIISHPLALFHSSNPNMPRVYWIRLQWLMPNLLLLPRAPSCNYLQLLIVFVMIIHLITKALWGHCNAQHLLDLTFFFQLMKHVNICPIPYKIIGCLSKKILRYLAGTIEFGIEFIPSS